MRLDSEPGFPVGEKDECEPSDGGVSLCALRRLHGSRMQTHPRKSELAVQVKAEDLGRSFVSTPD